MRLIKIFFILSLFSCIGFLAYYFFFLPPSTPIEQFYNLETPINKEIKQIISTTGSLKLKDQVKIGSVVSGRVKDIYVKENDLVTEGQLLAEIDTGLGDTEVREAQGAYEKALAELEFEEANFHRQRQLFNEKFISEASLQEAKRNYLTTVADVKTLQAAYEKKVNAYENNKVYSPASGIIIHVDAVKGEKVTEDLKGGTILSLAPNINHIEAEIDINERDIGQIQNGQKVRMVVDTYPNKVFDSTIQSISFIAKERNEDKEKECIYQAKAYIENPNLLLRPGMSVNAKIEVAVVESTLALTSKAFIIKEEHLKKISELLNLSIKPLDRDAKASLLQNHADHNMQFVWQNCNNCFQEISVEIGITDNIYFQIKSGLKGDENLVVEVLEDDLMQKVYDNIYRRY